MSKCNANALGIALAFVSGLAMLILGLLGAAGYAQEAVQIMQAFHIWFDVTAVGIIAGIIEAAVFSYIAGWLIAAVYNKYAA